MGHSESCEKQIKTVPAKRLNSFDADAGKSIVKQAVSELISKNEHVTNVNKQGAECWRPALRFSLPPMDDRTGSTPDEDAEISILGLAQDVIENRVSLGELRVAGSTKSIYETICEDIMAHAPEVFAGRSVLGIDVSAIKITSDAQIDFEAISRASEDHVKFEEALALGSLKRKKRDQDTIAHIDSELEKYAGREITLYTKNALTDSLPLGGTSIEKTAVFVVENLKVGEVRFSIGCGVHPPGVEEIAEKYGLSWLPELFLSWDTELATLSRDTIINAVLRDSHTVTVYLDGEVYVRRDHVLDGLRTKDVLRGLVEQGEFAEPFFSCYEVSVSSQVISADTVINIRMLESSGLHKVAFYVDLADLGMSEDGLSGTEVSEASRIKEVMVKDGYSAIPPNDAELAAKGLKMPFSRYYEWDVDFEAVNRDLSVRACPIDVVQRLKSIASFVRDAVNSDGAASVMSTAAFTGKRFISGCFDSYKEKRMNKIFDNGAKIDSGDFTFSKVGDELMLMSFSGTSMDVVVPAYVNGFPVRYLSSRFLNGGFGIMNNYKWRSLKNSFGAENIGGTSLHSVKSIAKGIRSLTLPNTLVCLPSKCFHGCAAMQELVLPEKLSMVAASAFDYCTIERIIFNGPSPAGLHLCRLSCKVYVRDEYYDTFDNVTLV